MANLKEDNTWEQGIYQFETSDPVMGGPNGIDNVPTRQLANRTLWLKNQLAAAEQSINTNQTNANNTYATKATTLTAGIGLTGGGTLGGNRVLSMGKPSKITATSTDEAVSDTHSHSIDKASTSVAGIVMLVNALNSTATDRALTAAQGKALADALGALGDEAFKQRGALGSRNLDTLKGITNFGVWFMSANAGATTALNYPAARAGTLLVLPSAYEGIQLYIPFEWAQIYIRNTTQSGAWSDWRIIGEVANSLTSTSATAALSAAQGKNLQDNKADKALNLTAGNGLTGGGTLAAARTIALGTPGKITASTTNSIGTATHTHEIDNASTTIPGVVKLNDTLSSQSTTEALTANQGRMLNNSKLGNSGNQIIKNGYLAVDNPDEWTALRKSVADGSWRIEFAPAGSADKRLNFVFSPTGGSSTYLRFAPIGNGETVAYESYVKSQIKSSRPLVAGADTAITLNVASRASIIAALGNDYIPYGHNQLVLHNQAVSNITNLPIADKSPLQLDIYVMGGYSMIVATYMPLGRRFWTRANWNNESLGLSWVEDLTERNGVMLAGNQDIGGVKTFAVRQNFASGLQAASSKTDFDAGSRITLGANTNDAWIKNETSGKFFALKNSGELHYGGHKVYTAEYKPSWVNDITNKPTTVAASGLTDAATKTEVSNAATAVKNEILGGAGAAFDTLKELAAALGNDANFANTITRELAKKADKATTLAGYGLGNAIAVLTGTIADGGTIPLPAGFSEAQCKFMVSTARDNPEDVPWDIDESGRHVHYGYECTLNGRVVSCKVWLNKNRTTMGNAHPEITVPGRANYLVIAYK